MATESKSIEVRVQAGKMGLYGGRRWREGQTLTLDPKECPDWKQWGVLVGTEEEAKARKELAAQIDARTGPGKKIALSEMAKNVAPDDPTHERK